MDKIYRILVINPGSTSTKLSMFENETCLFTEDVFHDSSVLKKFPTINDQLDYRMEVVDKFLKDGNIDLTGVDAIVGRGGGCYSVEGGIYKIDDRLIQDTKAAKGWALSFLYAGCADGRCTSQKIWRYHDYDESAYCR